MRSLLGMLVRSWPALALLAFACGGGTGETEAQPEPTSGGTAGQSAAGASSSPTAGSVSSTAGTSSDGGAATAGGGQVSAAGQTQTAAGTGGATAGQASGGANQAGSASGGADGGKAGTPTAGAGGKAPADPLEPKPAANCPGYVDVLVPVGTCVLVKGNFTTQNQACNVVDPPETKCATVSATQKDLVSRLSSSAVIERSDFDQAGCPKKCN